MSDTIDVGEGYRRLVDGEILQSGDEIWYKHRAEWQTTETAGLCQSGGLVYRRRITPAQPAAEKPFYMVWKSGGGTPIYNHDTLQAAQQEAQRLAKKQVGDRFYVLQSFGYAVVPIGNVEFHKSEVTK
jgi:hypothetical protein